MPNSLDPRMIDPSKSAVTFTATTVVTPSGTSDLWNAASSLVRANSASWEESADILPTVTNYLSTSNVRLSALTVTDNISSTGLVSASALSLSAVTFTNRFTVATSLTATTTVLEVVVNGTSKYLPLFDIN